MLTNTEATILQIAAQSANWTTISGPMSLAAQTLAAKGYAETRDGADPLSIRIRPTDAGRKAVSATN